MGYVGTQANAQIWEQINITSSMFADFKYRFEECNITLKKLNK